MYKIYILFFQKNYCFYDMFHTESYRHTHQTGSKQCASGNYESSQRIATGIENLRGVKIFTCN